MKKITAATLCLTFFACTNQASQQNRESGFLYIRENLGEDKKGTSNRSNSKGSFKPSQGQGSEVNSEQYMVLEDNKGFTKVLKDPVAQIPLGRYDDNSDVCSDEKELTGSEKLSDARRSEVERVENQHISTRTIHDSGPINDNNQKRCWDWVFCCCKKWGTNYEKNRTEEDGITSHGSTLYLKVIAKRGQKGGEQQLQAKKINDSHRLVSDDLEGDVINYKNETEGSSLNSSKRLLNDNTGY